MHVANMQHMATTRGHYELPFKDGGITFKYQRIDNIYFPFYFFMKYTVDII